MSIERVPINIGTTSRHGIGIMQHTTPNDITIISVMTIRIILNFLRRIPFPYLFFVTVLDPTKQTNFVVVISLDYLNV